MDMDIIRTMKEKVITIQEIEEAFISIGCLSLQETLVDELFTSGNVSIDVDSKLGISIENELKPHELVNIIVAPDLCSEDILAVIKNFRDRIVIFQTLAQINTDGSYSFNHQIPLRFPPLIPVLDHYGEKIVGFRLGNMFEKSSIFTHKKVGEIFSGVDENPDYADKQWLYVIGINKSKN